MVRSILLRGFDQQMAQMIGDYMENHGVKFIRECIPTSLHKVNTQLEDNYNKKPSDFVLDRA